MDEVDLYNDLSDLIYEVRADPENEDAILNKYVKYFIDSFTLKEGFDY